VFLLRPYFESGTTEPLLRDLSMCRAMNHSYWRAGACPNVYAGSTLLRRCSCVPGAPHCEQASLTMIRMLCSLTFGGTRSWIDIYHRKVTAPVTSAWGKFPHTKCQLIDGTCWLLSRSKPRASCPQGPWICHTRTAYKCSPIPPFVGA
jgi:hypothetical protein